MRGLTFYCVLAGSALTATSVFAEAAAPEKARFRLQATGVAYKSTTVKPDKGDSVTTTQTDTVPSNLQLDAFFGPMALYVPLLVPANPIGVGYMVTKEFEVALLLSLNNAKVGKADASSNNTTGFYVAAYPGANVLNFEVKQTSGTTVTPENATATPPVPASKTNFSTLAATASYQYNFELASNLKYAVGASYSVGNSKKGDAKSSTNALSVTLARFKYMF